MDKLFEVITKLSVNRAVNIGFITFGNFIGPFWFIFQFAPGVYSSNDLVRMIILSLAAGIPVTLMHFTMNTTINRELPKKETDSEKATFLFESLGSVSLIAGFGYYFPCAITYFDQIEQREAIAWAVSYNAFMIIVGFFPDKKKKITTKTIEKPPADKK